MAREKIYTRAGDDGTTGLLFDCDNARSLASTLAAALYISNAASNTITASYFLNTAGYGAQLVLRSTGNAIVEVYEADTTGGKFMNLSTRARVTGTSVPLTPGFVVSPGSGTRKFLIPAAGPPLGGLGLTGLITWAEIRLRKVSGPYIDMESIRFDSLDEFFEIRVAGLKQRLELDNPQSGPDGLTPQAQMEAIATQARDFVASQYDVLNRSLLPALASAGIRLVGRGKLNRAQSRWAREYFEAEVEPVLTPLGLDPGRPFPRIQNKSLNFVVREIGRAHV